MSDFLSIKDAAAFLDVEYKTVYRLVTTGELPAARVGKLYRIERHDLEAYLQSTKKAAPVGTPVSPEDHLLCGACGRVIPDPDLSGGQCAERACDELLCTTCWGRGVRHCRTHQPTADQQLAQARQALAQGRVIEVEPAAQRGRSRGCGGRVDGDDFEVGAPVRCAVQAQQPVVRAEQRMGTARAGRHAQRGFAPGHPFVQRGRGHHQVIDVRSAGQCVHSRTVPSMQVTLAPPTQTVPSASR